jgi:D-alanyl-D-alanine carboxypeptidase
MRAEKDFQNIETDIRLRKNKGVVISALFFLVIAVGLLFSVFSRGENIKRWSVANTFMSSDQTTADDTLLACDRVEKNNKEREKLDIMFEDLVLEEPNAPVKVMGMGNFYARAKAAVSIDADTHTILHYQNGKEKMAIASLTKIMTAVLAVEKIENLDNEYVTIDDEVFATDGTKIGCPRSGYCISNHLQVGEEISARYLFEAMLMNSANDAAVALAKHIAGSQENFAKMMNEKARQLGLTDSNFCNPSGLDDDDNPKACYSSAYDIARIAAYSLKYKEIWDVMKIKEKDIFSKDGKIVHHIINTDILIDQIPNCLGGKTGFTYEAGKSLMMAAHHPADKEKIVVAVLLDDVYRWEDMPDLINWSFQAYNWLE